MANVICYKGEKIETVKHRDLKAGDVFCYPCSAYPSIFMKIEVHGDLHTVKLSTGEYFEDDADHCLESDVIKLDALIFVSADKSRKEN